MLRVYFLQNWYALSDPMAEETLYDSETMRRFAGIELGDDRIPDETTILNFQHLLERHGLAEAIFADVNAHLADKGITLRSGTLVNATIIDAPSSTKNKAGARDPKMPSTKKGNDWYFGSEEEQKLIQGINFPTNAHIGVDVDSGVTHSLDTTTAKVHDSQSGMSSSTARKPRSGPTRAMSAPRARPRSKRPARSGVSCAMPPRVASCIPSTNGSTASSRWSGPRSSIPSG